MDAFYISHGSPKMSIDEGIPARKFLESWREKVMPGERPKAILVISGHWETDCPSVNVISTTNATIYDFYGFPEPMYQLKYPAPGAPELAMRVKELLEGGGFKKVEEERSRGLDHGAWVPLMLMYPDADIPVCQLSVLPHKDSWYHYNMGKALRPLREDGVLVMGSGSATHILRTVIRDNAPAPKWAVDFDAWLKDSLLSGRYEDVNDYLKMTPAAEMAHPRPDHFYPLHVAMGAGGEGAKAELLHYSWSNGSLSYSSYRFTSRKISDQ